MTVQDFIEILQTLEEDAVVEIASDEEGNEIGDVDTAPAEGELSDGRKTYTFYPINAVPAEERYT